MINELYGGEIQLEFKDFGHAYFLKPDNIKIPSVTTITSMLGKPFLVGWAANQAVDFMVANIKPGVPYDELQLNSWFRDARKAHNQKKQDAADIGSMVHQWISDYIGGKNPDMPVNESMNTSITNFLKWKDDNKVKFNLSEQPVYSKEYGYCGRLDFVANIDGSLFLGDIKTSKEIYSDYWIQLSAYGIARAEEFPNEDYKHQGIIRISKDGSFEFKTSDDPSACFDAFLCCKGLYEWQELMKKT